MYEYLTGLEPPTLTEPTGSPRPHQLRTGGWVRDRNSVPTGGPQQAFISPKAEPLPPELREQLLRAARKTAIERGLPEEEVQEIEAAITEEQEIQEERRLIKQAQEAAASPPVWVLSVAVLGGLALLVGGGVALFKISSKKEE